MLHQLQLKHYEDTKQQMALHQKKEEITATVEELKHVEQVENQRQIQIENLIYDYNLKLGDTRRKNDVLMQEKNITVSNHEHDTQKLLLKLVEHLRGTKVLRA